MKLLRLGTARRQLHTPASFSDRLTPVAHTRHGAYTLTRMGVSPHIHLDSTNECNPRNAQVLE